MSDCRKHPTIPLAAPFVEREHLLFERVRQAEHGRLREPEKKHQPKTPGGLVEARSLALSRTNPHPGYISTPPGFPSSPALKSTTSPGLASITPTAHRLSGLLSHQYHKRSLLRRHFGRYCQPRTLIRKTRTIPPARCRTSRIAPRQTRSDRRRAIAAPDRNYSWPL